LQGTDIQSRFFDLTKFAIFIYQPTDLLVLCCFSDLLVISALTIQQ